MAFGLIPLIQSRVVRGELSVEDAKRLYPNIDFSEGTLIARAQAMQDPGSLRRIPIVGSTLTDVAEKLNVIVPVGLGVVVGAGLYGAMAAGTTAEAIGASAAAGEVSTSAAVASGTAASGGTAAATGATLGGYGTVVAAEGGGAALIGGATAGGAATAATGGIFSGITATTVATTAGLVNTATNLLRRFGINIGGSSTPDYRAPSPGMGNNFGAIYPQYLEGTGPALDGYGFGGGEGKTPTLRDLLGAGGAGILFYILAAALVVGGIYFLRRRIRS